MLVGSPQQAVNVLVYYSPRTEHCQLLTKAYYSPAIAFWLR